jgi:hypothetical protein
MATSYRHILRAARNAGDCAETIVYGKAIARLHFRAAISLLNPAQSVLLNFSAERTLDFLKRAACRGAPERAALSNVAYVEREWLGLLFDTPRRQRGEQEQLCMTAHKQWEAALADVRPIILALPNGS